MNNIESGKELLSTAKRIMERDLQEAWEDNDDNLVVRRAQEVVELALKGALKFLGVEYPKVHDVGKIFDQTVKRKVSEFDEEAIGKIIRISARLAEDRGPSFYGEKILNREEAAEAYSDAKFVYNEVIKILPRVLHENEKGDYVWWINVTFARDSIGFVDKFAAHFNIIHHVK